MRVVLVGNPNVGKSSLFNLLTASNVKVGNWPGVTVEREIGKFDLKGSKRLIECYDLPGVYSLCGGSCPGEDEQITLDFLANTDNYDVILNVVDASNLERNLYLTLELLSLGKSVVMILTKNDLAVDAGLAIDLAKLKRKLGLEVVDVNPRLSGAGQVEPILKVLARLFELESACLSISEQGSISPYWVASPPEGLAMTELGAGTSQEPLAVVKFTNRSAPPSVIASPSGGEATQYGEIPESLIDRSVISANIYRPIQKELAAVQKLLLSKAGPGLAIRLLEGGDGSAAEHVSPAVVKMVKAIKAKLTKKVGEDLDVYVPALRYEYISKLISHAVSRTHGTGRNFSEAIDKVVMNKFLSIPIFLLVMYLVFTFSMLASEALQGYSERVGNLIFVDWSRSLLEFIHAPRVLSFLISDAVGGGMTTVMTFVPVIFSLYLVLAVLEDSGYMARAAFTMNHALKFLGLSGQAFVPLIISFGCNVPGILATRTLSTRKDRVITAMMAPFMSCGARLSIYALFCATFFVGNAQNVVFLLYLIGIAVSIVTGLLLNKLFNSRQTSSFMIELHRYQLPVPRLVFKHAWSNTRGFIFGAGKLIVITFMILQTLKVVGWDGKILSEQEQDRSIISSMSQKITPGFKYMGIEQHNWPAVVGIFTGIFAKEVVVGTLTALYGRDEDAIEGSQGLHLEKYFQTKASAFAYLLFILLYFPCISVFSVIAQEIGMRWAVFSMVWSTSIAFAVATAFYQISQLVH